MNLFQLFLYHPSNSYHSLYRSCWMELLYFFHIYMQFENFYLYLMISKYEFEIFISILYIESQDVINYKYQI